MKQLIFATGNDDKYKTAQTVCAQSGIDVLQRKIAVDEIQSENPEVVARDKASRAFAILQQPVLISDDSWAFAGLNGFPGVYMHSMNHWLTPEDFLRLTLPLENRETILTQYLVYDDGEKQRVFTAQSRGKLLKEVRGESSHPSHTVISMDGDEGLSIAEVFAKGADYSNRDAGKIWHEFVAWYTSL